MNDSIKTSINTVVGSWTDKKGEHAVYYRVGTHGSIKYINTGVRVSNDELAPDGKTIRNHRKMSALERKRLELLDKVYMLELESLSERRITAEFVVSRLLAVPDQVEFFSYAEKWLKQVNIAQNGKNNYKVMLNKLAVYLGKRNLPFDMITYGFLTKYEQWLRNEGITRLGIYLGGMRHVYREAMLEYNTDFDTVIKNDPFSRYRVPRQQARKGVRALSLDEFLRIYDYKPKKGTVEELGHDLFIMSFCLMGMNIPDFYEVADGRYNVLRYKRHKTRMRRSDEAYIEVNVHPFLEPLMRKYKGRNRVFCFSSRYATYQNFGRAVNQGLKKVAEGLGLDNLQFYQARHTFATLSRNLMKFPKSDVDEALNHVGNLSIADVYIAKDFSIINDNNKKLIDEVFKNYM